MVRLFLLSTVSAYQVLCSIFAGKYNIMTYDHFRYKPFDKSTVDELCQLPEFQFNFKDKDKSISFIILVWDPQNRDWQKQHTRYIDLKREAAILAGFTLEKNNRFKPEVEDLIVGKHFGFNKAVIRYLYLIAIPELPALAAHRELLSAEIEAAFNPETDAKERKEIRINLDAGTIRIAEYEAAVFGGTETEALRTELYKYLESNKIQLRPEHIALSIKAGTVADNIGLGIKRPEPPDKNYDKARQYLQSKKKHGV